MGDGEIFASRLGELFGSGEAAGHGMEVLPFGFFVVDDEISFGELAEAGDERLNAVN